MAEEEKDDKKVVQKKCLSCGASDISLDIKTGKLRCNYCGTEYTTEKVENDKDIENLYGEKFSEGTSDLSRKEEKIITLKCDGCGAEIMINESDLSQAKCHWCGSALSINQKIANGNIPDMILPFKITRQEAKAEMDNFIGRKRRMYAVKGFLNNLKEENIKGVYLPYMIIDVNSHAKFSGKGEITTRKYTIEDSNGNTETRYDANLYNIKREFDITMQDLTVEANADRFNTQSDDKTNNIINAILPFDTDNCVKWDPNYLRGYALEKRDLNVNDVNMLVDVQAKDIARYKANETLKDYDRGVKWNEEDLSIKGTQWKLAYLPVWLYSYQEKDKENKIVQHYIAVNARTKETMGSVPMDPQKFILGIIGADLLFLVLLFALSLIFRISLNIFMYIILLVVFTIFNYKRKKKMYYNSDERHYHEKDTKSEMSNIVREDKLIRTEHELKSSKMEGINNMDVYARTGPREIKRRRNTTYKY